MRPWPATVAAFNPETDRPRIDSVAGRRGGQAAVTPKAAARPASFNFERAVAVAAGLVAMVRRRIRPTGTVTAARLAAPAERGFDSARWHVRDLRYEHGEFRDFLLAWTAAPRRRNRRRSPRPMTPNGRRAYAPPLPAPGAGRGSPRGGRVRIRHVQWPRRSEDPCMFLPVRRARARAGRGLLVGVTDAISAGARQSSGS